MHRTPTSRVTAGEHTGFWRTRKSQRKWRGACLALTLIAASTAFAADPYPAKPVKLVIRQFMSGHPRFDRRREAIALQHHLMDLNLETVEVPDSPLTALLRELALQLADELRIELFVAFAAAGGAEVADVDVFPGLAVDRALDGHEVHRIGLTRLDPPRLRITQLEVDVVFGERAAAAFAGVAVDQQIIAIGGRDAEEQEHPLRR